LDLAFYLHKYGTLIYLPYTEKHAIFCQVAHFLFNFDIEQVAK